MKKTKALSLLLSMSLAASLAFPSGLAMPSYADYEPSTISDNDDGTSAMELGKTAKANDDGTSAMELSKTAVANGDGTYTIQLEAYATGSKVTTSINKDIPTDIVLVLDQSGSMADKMSQYEFAPYTGKTNGQYYELRHNGATNPNLWHKLADGSYTSVSVTITGEDTYKHVECPENWKNDSWYGEDCYWKYRNNLYVKVGDKYERVILNRDGFLFYYTYTYTFPDGTRIPSEGDDATPNFDDNGPVYYRVPDDGAKTYTYTYKDKEGETHTIGTSKGKDTKPTDFTLYERYASVGTTTRLQALKDAVANFIDSVEKKAAGEDGDIATTADNINHRIAVVGFASKSGNGNNTELLSISGRNSGSVGVAYNSITQQNLKDVLQNMDTIAGREMVGDALDALAASGATRTDLGMDMAQRILNANPVLNAEKRNRVVIVFTDGSPTSSNGFELDVANAAINKADAIKNSGATVYSIGIFEGADASSAGTKPSGDLENNSSRLPAACNWFMQKLSSNNGTPEIPGYYLSASDANTLNNIFKQISDQIETGTASTVLDEKAVVKDIISPYFQLPEGATANDITLETYAYGTGGSWTNNNNTMGAHATVNGTGEVEVTGFHFSDNWCGTETKNGVETPHGNKLVISFKVVPKEGFLGGNGVPTNERADVTQTIDGVFHEFIFPIPEVNVPIPDITVTAEDKNVYLMGNISAAQMKEGVTAMAGGVNLFNQEEYTGVNAWKDDFVTITTTVTDKDGTEFPKDGLNNLTKDGDYFLHVKLTPNKEPAQDTAVVGAPAVEKIGNGEMKIKVFQPELTFKDYEGYYGDTVPAFRENPTQIKWKHGEEVAVPAQMTGTEPSLDITYTPDATKIENGKINSKQDIPVKAEVKINNTNVTDKTTFQHQACSPACGWTDPNPNNGDPAFLLHVKTCQLTITKSGGDANEPYVFTVNKDGQKYTEVTIVGNGNVTIKELPVGTYIIEEDTGWSWRYTATISGDATLSANSPNGTITCTNTKNNDQWLNGFSAVARNIYGQPNSTGRRAK